MNTSIEILSFLGGCIFYAFRGAVGKVLLNLLIKLAKVLFKFTAAEAALYVEHKEAATSRKTRQ